MDYSHISFDASWSQTKDELEEQKSRAIMYAILFSFTASQLLIAIIRTIATNPGNIPDHKEWDMSTDTQSGEDSATMISATTGTRAQERDSENE